MPQRRESQVPDKVSSPSVSGAPGNRALMNKNGVRTKRTPARAKVIVECVAEGWSIRMAAERAGMSRRAVYDWKDADPDFAKALEEAHAAGTELLEDELRRRAGGYEVPVFFRGEQTDTREEYSEKALFLALRARDPEKYGDRTNHRHELHCGVTIDFAERLRAAHERAGTVTVDGSATSVRQPDGEPETAQLQLPKRQQG